MNSLVSVIIPVYNVERYVRKCVNSVRRQTYRNLEILLIDDGSTDRSGSICDALAETDSRIRVIHKTYGGPSAARNCGLRIASGKYVAFADSDDYIQPNMIEKLLSAFAQSDVDAAACNYEFVFDNGKKKPHRTFFQTDQLLSGREAVRCLLSEQYFRCYVWNKMFRAELFRDVVFPEGVIYEDIITCYRLLAKAKRVLYFHDTLYAYRQHSGSITQKSNKSPKDLAEIIRAIREIRKCEHDDPRVCAFSLLYFKYYFHDLIKAGAWNDEVYREYIAVYSKCRKTLHKSKDILRMDKAELGILYLNHSLHRKLYKIFCSLKERLSE